MKLINYIKTKTKIKLDKFYRKIRKMGDIRSVPSSSSSSSQTPGISTTIFNDHMKRELNRLRTFKQSPTEPNRALAKKGFYLHERMSTIVECYACGARMDYPLKFSSSNIESEHLKLNKDCLFLKGQATNVPLPTKSPEPNNHHQSANISRGHDCTGTGLFMNNNVDPTVSMSTERRLHDSTSESVISRISSIQPRIEQVNPYNRPAVNCELMKSEYERLKTFMSVPPWPVSFIRPEDCARAGFFSLKEGDKVQCAFCRGVAGEWEPDDIPLVEHERHFPRCPFICNVPVGNIPMGQEEEEEDEDEMREGEPLSEDVCGPFETSNMNPNGPHAARMHGVIPLTGNYDTVASNLAIKTARGPMILEMVTPQARLKSFTDLKWPSSTGQDPERMVDAGFAFTGFEDHVKCFYCNGGLRNWEPNDDPWVEHAKWFPRCTYILLHKGEDFIHEVNQTTPPKESELPSTSGSSSSNSNHGSVSSSTQFCSSDEEEMETVMGRAGNKDVAGTIASSSGVSSTSSCSPCSDLSSTNSAGRESSSSGNSSGDDEDKVTASSKNKKCSRSKERDLEEEVRKLREAHQCKICMDNEVSVVFLPCGHLVSCVSCATAFKNCALCREPIKAFVRTYMS